MVMKFPPRRWRKCPACGEKHLGQFRHCNLCMAWIHVNYGLVGAVRGEKELKEAYLRW